MIVVQAPNETEPTEHYDHLTAVTERMKKLGPPRIRVVRVRDNVYRAIEGSHRLQAAADLKFIPNFVVITKKFRTIQHYGRLHLGPPPVHWTTPKEFIKNTTPWGVYHKYTDEEFASGGKRL